MATRSTIAIENLDGTVNQVYCHWDGYIEHNGRILQENYTTREQVEELIAYGGISSLGKKVSSELIPFKNSQDNNEYTIYYCYRGEDVQIDAFEDFKEYEKEHVYEDYEYIFTKDNVWLVMINDGNDVNDKFISLEEKLNEIKQKNNL